MYKIEDIINRVHCADCLEFMRIMPDNSIDSIVTDPPAGISFMGKEWDTFGKGNRGTSCRKTGNGNDCSSPGFAKDVHWDKDKKSRNHFIEWLSSVMAESLRILKPGGHALIWSLPRTSHWTAFALEDAAFEISDCIYHVFGSGFPKSLSIDKAIDKKACREKLEKELGRKATREEIKSAWEKFRKIDISIPATLEAKQWKGWGTALKPAVECWWLCRKPLSEKTVAENVLKWGTGGINVDESRIPINPEVDDMRREVYRGARDKQTEWGKNSGFKNETNKFTGVPKEGRFPANLVLSCICDKVITEPVEIKNPEEISGGLFHKSTGKPAGNTYKGGNQIHTNPLCPCYQLNMQSGIRKSGKMKQYIEGGNFNVYGKQYPREVETIGDMGGASRFFYIAKSSKSERDWICQNNNHPTVKPIVLMEYLVKLITPKNGIVLDMFAGSGSTLIACNNLGYKFIGIEKDNKYCEIARKRLAQGVLL